MQRSDFMDSHLPSWSVRHTCKSVCTLKEAGWKTEKDKRRGENWRLPYDASRDLTMLAPLSQSHFQPSASATGDT